MNDVVSIVMQVATHQHARIYGENISISAGGFCVIAFSPCCWDTPACSFEPVEGARALEVYCMDDICGVYGSMGFIMCQSPSPHNLNAVQQADHAWKDTECFFP